MEKKGSEFDRSDLVRNMVAQSFEPSENDTLERLDNESASLAAELFIRGLTSALAEFGRVEIHELGVFTLVDRQPDSGTLPNGERWETPARKKIVFRPSPKMLEIVASVQDIPVY